VNVLGDMTGPGTVGIKGDSQAFFLVSCNQEIKEIHLFLIIHP